MSEMERFSTVLYGFLRFFTISYIGFFHTGCKLKLNEKQKRLYILIEFFFSEQNLLLQHWKFSNKNFSRYIENPFSCHITFQIVLGLLTRMSHLKSLKMKTNFLSIFLSHLRFLVIF